MDKTFDPAHLDIQAFALAGARLQGESALAQWPRLQAEQWPAAGADLAGTQPGVQWRLQGKAVPVAGGAPRIGLLLWAEVPLSLQCQRCLAPVALPVQAEREFLFVADEATAQALDDSTEEDVLVLSRDFDALALVEDELILALPLVPSHRVCPQTLPAQAADADFEAASERPNPFAVLARLKKQD